MTRAPPGPPDEQFAVAITRAVNSALFIVVVLELVPTIIARLEGGALACVMMLERVNYLLSTGVALPRQEMVDRLTAVIYAAFQPGRLDVGLVDVAPPPVLARLERLHDGVADGMGMRAGVPEWGRVAAPDVPAGQAEPQVDPFRAQAQALLTALGGARRDRPDHGQVRIERGVHVGLLY